MAGIFVVLDQPPSSDTLYLVNLDMAGMYMNRITETVLTSSVSWSVFVFPFNKKKTL